MPTLRGVEIFEVGTHNGDTYTRADLDAMVEASTKVGFRPPIKLGHSDKQELLQQEGLPAAGWVTNLRRVGNKLVADLVDIPKKVFELIKKGLYDRVSAEIYWDYVTKGGMKYPKVLKAVALLGADIPAVTSLEALRKLLGEEGTAAKVYTFGLVENRQISKYIIRKRGDEYCLLTSDGSKVLGCHPTLEEAQEQERAIKAQEKEKQAAMAMHTKPTRRDIEDDLEALIDLAKAGKLKGLSKATVEEMASGEVDFQGNIDAIIGAWDDWAGSWTRCVEVLKDKPNITNPEALCAWLHHEAEGKWPAEGVEGQVAHIHKEEEQAMDEKERRQYESKIAELTKQLEELKAKGRSGSEDYESLKADLAAAKAELAALHAERRREKVAAFVEQQVKAGRVTPALKPMLVAVFEGIDESREVVFSADGKKENEQKIGVGTLLRQFIEKLPVVAHFDEVGEGEKVSPDVDDVGAEVDRRVKKYIAEHKLDAIKDYSRALKDVLAADPELRAQWTALLKA
jgi:hypothetical protein